MTDDGTPQHESATGGPRRNTAFLALGIAFFVIWASTDNIAFMPIGIVFFVIGAEARAKSRRRRGVDSDPD